jgi:MFS family permease
LISIGSNLGFLIGPVLGGLLIGLLARDNTPEQLRLAAYVVFGFNALSFVASAAVVRSIHGPFSEDRDATVERDTGMRVGVRYLLHDRVLRTITLAWIVFLFGAGATLVAELPLAEAFGTGAVGYGALSSMWAGGAAVGAFLGSRYLTARREPAALVAGTATMGIGLGLISVAPWFAMVLPFMLFAGTGEGFSGVAEQSVLQRFTPDEVRSRVISASEGAIVAVFALSFLAGGPLVELLGVRRAYFVAGMSGIAAALVMATIVPQIRARESAQKSLDQG